MLDGVFLLGRHDAVAEDQFLGIVDTHSFAGTIPVDALEEQVMNGQTFHTGDVHCLVRVNACDIAEGEIAPFGEELTLIIVVGSASTTRCAIGITGLEEESRFTDVFHGDIDAVDIFAPTTTTRR